MKEGTGSVSRRLPVGAEVSGDNTDFRVWAPGHDRVEVVTNRGASDLKREAGGYFRGSLSGSGAGTRYRYRLDGKGEFPDPASRFQPEGPHGPSEVVDPSAFRWTDGGWRGVPLERAVIYEMHIGTFTSEGTWAAAMQELPALRDVGITVLEVMPIADFSGRFGWGYDGVNLFAPTRLYGRPDDFRSFVDRAHSLGMAVILDVVYNHVGADGNYLGEFTKDYFSSKHTTDWGDAINFDGPQSGPVREFFVANARSWIDEFHLDGLRLDATQNIYDESERHILADITSSVRSAAQGRVALLVAENEPQQTRLVRPAGAGGYGIDALWNDDFHHSAVVALTGRNEAYYTDYGGKAAEFVAAAKYGYLYQGQYYKWQKKRRGTSTAGIRPAAFVTFIENHDQVANSAWGARMSTQAEPALLRAMTALVLLGPGTPMLFQGQEFGSSRTFHYFADVPQNLGDLVREGRKEFLSQWRSVRMPEMLSCLVDPCSVATFMESKLDHGERDSNRRTWNLHADLLRLRRDDPVLSSWSSVRYDGAALTDSALVLRAFSEEHADRLLVFNFGRDLHLDPAPEPLLAPPEQKEWEILFSTEHPRYGGCGTAPVDSEENWRIPGHAALVLRPAPAREEKRE
jgi:maltooligosyltrehalose trehalohydrolase